MGMYVIRIHRCLGFWNLGSGFVRSRLGLSAGHRLENHRHSQQTPGEGPPKPAHEKALNEQSKWHLGIL